MITFLKRVASRLFPERVREEFEVEAIRPDAVGYCLRATVEVGGLRQATTSLDEKGRFRIDGVTYRLDPASWQTRMRVADRAGARLGAGELLFSGEGDEERLRTILEASPEVRVRPAARELLDRSALPLRVKVDFDAESGDTSVRLDADGEPVGLPETVGPVFRLGTKWFRVTPAQRELLGRLSRHSPRRDSDGKYQFRSAATPELMPYLQSRADVDLSDLSREVSVSAAPLRPTVQLEELPDQTLSASPAWETPGAGDRIEREAVSEAGPAFVRHGSAFFPAPSVLDPVFEELLRGSSAKSVAPDVVPDFLAGPPGGIGAQVGRRWTGQPLEVDARDPEVRVDVELDEKGALRQKAAVETADGEVLYAAGRPRPTGRWKRRERRFFREPSPEQVRDVDGVREAITSIDEQAQLLLEHGRKGSKRFRLGSRARAVRLGAEPTTRVQSSVDVHEGTGSVRVRISHEGEVASIPHEALRQVPAGQRWFRQGDSYQRINWGQFHAVDREVQALGGEAAEGAYSFPSYLYEEIISKFGTLGLLEQTELFQRWLTRILDFEKIEAQPLPRSLKSRWQPALSGDGRPIGIRPYQQKGYEWLCFLKRYGFGGILADEMGLGKTVQALLSVARYKEDRGRWCSLIITTKSAMSHWEKDARDFFEGLAVARWANFERAVVAAKPDQIEQKYDIVLVNYERVLSDVDYLAKLKFRFVLLDEAQRLKNPKSKRRAAVARLRAESRIAVTATPVETRLLDMWSIFDVMMKGKLGSENEFVARFEKTGDTRGLSVKVRPFVLIRKKSMPEIQVQLPGKTYRDRECEMEPEQRTLYDRIRRGGRALVEESTGRGQPAIAGNAHIFAILTRLLQVCLHPSLVDEGGRGPERSGKGQVVKDLIEELLEDGTNRILVFSRWVEGIRLLEEWIGPIAKRVDAEARAFVGATSSRERDVLIQTFNSRDSRQRILLLSLHAGGVGVNLQAANHVVHFDRWWNPAVELQAEDRAYRMNSERPVTVHRITTKDSIEEHVAAKIESRLHLVRDIMDPQVALEKLITREELLEIFGIHGKGSPKSH